MDLVVGFFAVVAVDAFVLSNASVADSSAVQSARTKELCKRRANQFTNLRGDGVSEPAVRMSGE